MRPKRGFVNGRLCTSILVRYVSNVNKFHLILSLKELKLLPPISSRRIPCGRMMHDGTQSFEQMLKKLL